MLRYLESASLIEPSRTASGYRLYDAGDLQRLRTLRDLLERFDCGLSDVAFAKRVLEQAELRDSLERWFEERPRLPEGIASENWLRFEQEKHERLLAAAG
jgi:MerR family copper efflux transcriptional regulator